MPRTSRQKSPTDIYHIILRGSNKQQIFYDDEDYRYFISILQKYKSISGFKLYAYCIMGNHIHLLIHICEEPIDTIIKRIGSAFVYWYNMKYERVGHLFQDRFKSEAVASEQYFLTVLRYILNNPVKAGFCEVPEQYPYSSGREYLCSDPGITDTYSALSMLGISTLSEYMSDQNDDQCMDIDLPGRFRLTDERAKQLIIHEFGTYSPNSGKVKDRSVFNESIRILCRSGISIRQLSRLTGISKKLIETALKNG